MVSGSFHDNPDRVHNDLWLVDLHDVAGLHFMCMVFVGGIDEHETCGGLARDAACGPRRRAGISRSLRT